MSKLNFLLLIVLTNSMISLLLIVLVFVIWCTKTNIKSTDDYVRPNKMGHCTSLNGIQSDHLELCALSNIGNFNFSNIKWEIMGERRSWHEESVWQKWRYLTIFVLCRSGWGEG